MMDGFPFVARDIERRTLSDALHRAQAGRGSLVLIEGDAGMGKSVLLRTVEQEASRNLDDARFVYGECYEDTGGHNAYQPWVEILAAFLEARKTRKDLAQLFLSIVKESGNDWLGIIPVAGPALSAGLKTASAAGEWLLGRSDSSRQSENLAAQYVNTIAKIAPRYAPLVLVVEDAHWIDPASCQLLMRLAPRLQALSLVVLVTFRPGDLSAGQPFDGARTELTVRNLASTVTLGPLRDAEIQQYVTMRFGGPLHPGLIAWLSDLSGGHPLFITQYLSLLEQEQVIRRTGAECVFDGEIRRVGGAWEVEGSLARLPVPKGIEMLLEQRIDRLEEEDRELLQLGAVQGQQFLSAVLVDLLEKNERDVLRRLRNVIARHRVIHLYTDQEIDRARSEAYAFEHALMQQAFYLKLSPRERLLYHRGIARFLETVLQRQVKPSRKLILDLAHHYEAGAEHLPAAHYYEMAAASLLSNGANIEATAIARRALRNVRAAHEDDRLLARVIELLLIATERRGQEEAIEENPLTLVEEAEQAAGRTGDLPLQARLRYLRGSVLGNLAGLERALPSFREALDLIQRAGDPVGEFVIMSQLGHQLRGQDFEAGFEMQHQAYSLFQRKVLSSRAEIPPDLKRSFHFGQTILGVAEFDRGDFGAAVLLLREGIAGLRELNSRDELPESLNYLAQTYLGMGQFESAQATIEEAIRMVEADEEPHSWTGYNLALLGKLFIEWERAGDAVEPMLKGWIESQRTPVKWGMPIIRNYRAELLIHPGYRDRDLAEADRLLIENIAETDASGHERSLVAALSLRSRLALMEQRIEDALEFSRRAVSLLDQLVTLPALRSEEVLFDRYRALHAAGLEDDARACLQRARSVLQKKAGSIGDETQRKTFLERVPLNRNIQSAMAGK